MALVRGIRKNRKAPWGAAVRLVAEVGAQGEARWGGENKRSNHV